MIGREDRAAEAERGRPRRGCSAGTLMRKTGSRQSRRWIRTRRARDHMQDRAKLIQHAPRGSPQHLTLNRWPGGLLFHDLGSPSASEPTATAPSRDSRPKGPRAAPVLRFLLTQSEYSGVCRERQRRRSGAVESRTGNLVSTRIDTPCLHVHETFCALGVGMGAHLRTRTVFEPACVVESRKE